MVGWLFEFWCTHSRDWAPHIKSEIFIEHHGNIVFISKS